MEKNIIYDNVVRFVHSYEKNFTLCICEKMIEDLQSKLFRLYRKTLNYFNIRFVMSPNLYDFMGKPVRLLGYPVCHNFTIDPEGDSVFGFIRLEAKEKSSIDVLDALRYSNIELKRSINKVFGINREENNMEQVYFIAKENIKDVIFNDPATIILWKDGTKTVVKCCGYEVYDPEKGLAMAIAKAALGNKSNYYDIFKKFLNKY